MKLTHESRSIRNRYVFSAVFAAMIAVSGFFIVPLPGGVPVVLKNLFVVLCGTVLGSYHGGIAVLIFITAGLAGIPVFTIPGGPGVFLTPLGGYIAGYFAGSLAAGFVCGLPKTSERKIRPSFVLRLCIASFLGFGLILICGVLYIKHLNSMTFKAAMAVGFLPFVLSDTVKLIVSIPLAIKLRPITARYINPDDNTAI